jgi:amidase
MTTELHYLELIELAEYLRRREISAVEATNAQLERIARLDPHLASYALITMVEALASAATADAEIAAGKYRGPLHGIPIGVKDLFFTRDQDIGRNGHPSRFPSRPRCHGSCTTA